MQDDEEFRFDASTSLREPDPVPIRPSRRVALVPHCPGETPQGSSGSEVLSGSHDEVDSVRFHFISVDVVDMTVADSDPDSEIHNRISDPVENDFQQPGRRRTTRGVHDVVPPSVLDDLELGLKPTPAVDYSFNPILENVTKVDTVSDASGAARQVSARRGRRLRILGTQPTVEDLPSTNRFSPLEDDSEKREGTSSESETESLPDPEYVVEESQPAPAIGFCFSRRL